MTGCSGDTDIGSSIRVPADQRQVVESSALGQLVDLPKDRPFNIHSKESSQNPGSQGTAQGAADANGWGEASGAAVAGEGGTASGQFSVGQAIDYRGTAPLQATVKVTFKVSHELSAEPPSSSAVGQIALTAFVRDSMGKVHPRIALESLSSDSAPGKASRSEAREFRFVMEPERSYHIVFHGSVSATTQTGTKATAKASINDLKMNITFSTPPPTTSTAPAAK
jgi:hypothetical protein